MSAIYYDGEEEREIARSVLDELNASHIYDKPSQVELLPRKEFYMAEEYHQKYAEKNPMHYTMYRTGSGREGFVQKTCQVREEKHIQWSE